MKLKCPHCQLAVSKKAIEHAENYAICPHCHLSFDVGGRAADSMVSGSSSFSETYGEFFSAEIPEKLTKYAPTGTKLVQNVGGVTITASTLSWISGLSLLFFAVIWNAVVIFAFYSIISDLDSGVPVFMLFFLVPFLLIGLVVAFQALMAFFGKIELVIGHESYAFTGIGPVGRKKRFDWNSIESIYTKTFTSRSSKGHTSYKTYIFMDGSNRVKFGSQLSGEKLAYVLEILCYLHENRK